MQKLCVALSLLSVLICGPAALAETKVTPKGGAFEGRVPRALTDKQGNVHFIFNHQGNVFYRKKSAGQAEFSEPIRVNSIERSAAIADLAVGPNGRVHILYHGNIHYIKEQMADKSQRLTGRDIKFTFYSRLNDAGDGFEEQREVSGGVWGYDGGCALAADQAGHVFLFFHGTTVGGGEQNRHLYMTVSKDDGKNFSEPRPIDLGKGVCICCHLSATVNGQGHILVAYRVAENSVNRDSYVLTSKDQGQTFQASPLDKWELRACPGSLYSFANHGPTTFVSWRSQDEIYFAQSGSERFISPPKSAQKRRAAILGSNSKGEVLLAWCEGDNFNKPHDLCWQLYDKSGLPIGGVGRQELAFERWANPAIYADAKGDFVILY